MTILIRRRTPSATLTVRMVLVALIALAAVFALAGCSTSGEVSVGIGGGKTSEVKTYTDPDYGYGFSYPAAWELKTGTHTEAAGGVSAANSVSVYDPKGTIAGDRRIDLIEFSVYELRVTVDDAMMPDVRTELEGVLANWAEQDESWETIEALAETTLAGLKGFVTTVRYDMDGVATTARLYFLFSGALEYEVMLQAATKHWDAKQADFDTIVSSFAPGS